MSTTTETRHPDADVLNFTYLVAGNLWPAAVEITVHDANPDALDDGRLVSVHGPHFDRPMTSDDVIRLAGLLLRAAELTRANVRAVA